VPRIASCRDRFYEALVAGVEGAHGERLRAESAAGKQPLAGARQHLNGQLARRRADQLAHVHLALLFARMGYPEAALRQARIVPAASARLTCEIQCRLTEGHRSIDEGQLGAAGGLLVEIEDFLRRAIECGALVDPWNILGFQGQFSLFPAPQNSVADQRIDDLVALVDEIFSLYARLWSEAAARGDERVGQELSRRIQALSEWWDRFAPTSVESIEAPSGAQAYTSAREVAEALAAFHQAGEAAGDIAFWRTRVASFDSAKAYALVVRALLEKPDRVAAMALLMQWLSQAGSIALKQGEYSFHALAERWLAEVLADVGGPIGSAPSPAPGASVPRFFDLLEANADELWQVPALELLGAIGRPSQGESPDEDDAGADEDPDPSLYSAAYDDMVYVDSTADGVDADMLESGGPAASDFELEAEARRVGERLEFLRLVAALWKMAVLVPGPGTAPGVSVDVIERWRAQAVENERRLVELLRSVHARRIPAPTAGRDSLLEFDRRRAVKDALVERVIVAAIETADAARAMRAALPASAGVAPRGESQSVDILDEVLSAVARGDAAGVRDRWPAFIEYLRERPLLYVPLGKGGDPARLAKARALSEALNDLVARLPRLGLLAETCQLLEAARLMETSHPVGPGAVSEYNHLFLAGYGAIAETLIDVSSAWPAVDAEHDRADNALVECLELASESLVKQWLAHSRTLRLSVLERVGDEKSWQALVAFVERYGRQLFTQPFLNPGNLRAILFHGVDAWLARLIDEADDEGPLLLVQELQTNLARSEAVKQTGRVIEAVVENYAEYRDYNTTTTQSDRGDLLYTFLDFLRLRAQYDRVAWHLKPLLVAHRMMVRRGRSGAAEAWRRAIAERTTELSDSLEKRYAELCKKYAMRLSTVADRIGERFVRPLTIDRVRALVKPAMDKAATSIGAPDISAAASASIAPCVAFELFEQETNELAQGPTGAGLDVPGWIAALEEEVEQVRQARHRVDPTDPWRRRFGQAPLTMEEVQRQLTGWELSSGA
jgi:hypothetical protein